VSRDAHLARSQLLCLLPSHPCTRIGIYRCTRSNLWMSNRRYLMASSTHSGEVTLTKEIQISGHRTYLKVESYLDISIKVIHSLCLYLHTLQTLSLQLQSCLDRVVDLAFHDNEKRACANTSIGPEALEPVREPVHGSREIGSRVWLELVAEVNAATSDDGEVELESGVETYCIYD
jgi:hypothetical protein